MYERIGVYHLKGTGKRQCAPYVAVKHLAYVQRHCGAEPLAARLEAVAHGAFKILRRAAAVHYRKQFFFDYALIPGQLMLITHISDLRKGTVYLFEASLVLGKQAEAIPGKPRAFLVKPDHLFYWQIAV